MDLLGLLGLLDILRTLPGFSRNSRNSLRRCSCAFRALRFSDIASDRPRAHSARPRANSANRSGVVNHSSVADIIYYIQNLKNTAFSQIRESRAIWIHNLAKVKGSANLN